MQERYLHHMLPILTTRSAGCAQAQKGVPCLTMVLLTWLGGSRQFHLRALLGSLQQDFPHLQTDTDVSSP